MSFGQQHLSGLGAGLGVMIVALGAYGLFGFAASGAAAVGAMCVSVVDQPGPAAHKWAALLLSLAFVALASLLVGLSQPYGILLGIAVTGLSFFAALLAAYGRTALPLSVSVSLALVLSLGTPLPTAAEAARHAAFVALGAAVYATWAMAAAHVLEFRNKQIALGDCLRALSDCLEAQARFFDRASDLDDVYRLLIDRQAVLTERLQAARNLLYDRIRTPDDRRLVAELFVVLDVFESTLSSQTDYRLLRRRFATAEPFTALRRIVLDMASDLDRLAKAIDTGRSPNAVNYRTALAPIGTAIAGLEEGTRKEQDAEGAQALIALRTTFNKTRYAVGELEELHGLATSAAMVPKEAVAVDLSRFVQRPSFRLRVLSDHFTLASPFLRYALRMALAMGSGFVLARILPYASHGNWILLTIALVMRANYSITKKRRTDRFVGNVLGCLVGAVLLHVLPPAAILLTIFAAIGVAHTYATRNYLVTATAACVMALLAIRILNPEEGALFIERILDTGVGAGLAYLFSYVLPHWEYESVPRLVQGLLKEDREYLGYALRVTMDDQGYRLSRKRMLDAMATLSATLSRMLDEPRSVRHRETEALGAFLTANHLLASHLASVQMFFRNRAREIDPIVMEQLVENARGRADAMLSDALSTFAQGGAEKSGAAIPSPIVSAEAEVPSTTPGGDPEAILRFRLHLVESEAQTLHALAVSLAAPYEAGSWRNWANVARSIR